MRLDYVIDYGELCATAATTSWIAPATTWRASPGRSPPAANLIYFVTGNGSITNFPFVPTMKIVTTTGRYDLLSRDMDVNAGLYLDGVPMDEVGRGHLRVDVACRFRRTVGRRARGPRAGVDLAQLAADRAGQVEQIKNAPPPTGKPLLVKSLAAGDPLADARYRALATDAGTATDQIGLVLPTSLCAGQIAQRIANHLNARKVGRDKIARFVALPHTEGCGVSSGNSEELYARTLIGHLLHPLVGPALLLEHGCEKTHNDYIRHELEREGADLSRFGWASIQLDGGIEAVVEKTSTWFAETIAASAPTREESAGLGTLRVGLASLGAVSPDLATSLSRLSAPDRRRGRYGRHPGECDAARVA